MSVMELPQVHSNPSTRLFFRWIRDIILTTEEDTRLCRIANGDYGDDDDNENETAPPTAEDKGKVSLPIRLPGVSVSGRRMTRFILR